MLVSVGSQEISKLICGKPFDFVFCIFFSGNIFARIISQLHGEHVFVHMGILLFRYMIKKPVHHSQVPRNCCMRISSLFFNFLQYCFFCRHSCVNSPGQKSSPFYFLPCQSEIFVFRPVLDNRDNAISNDSGLIFAKLPRFG